MTASKIDIDKIIAGCIENNRLSQRELYESYAPKMFVICRRYARNSEDAEDILMEGFMEVFKSLKNFQRKSSFDQWIHSVMVNTAVSHYRSTKRFRAEEQMTDDVENVLSVDEETTILAPIEAKMLLTVMERMPDTLRTVFNLRAVDGFSFEEMADMLGKKVNAVRINYMRARQWLMTELKGFGK